MSWDLQIRRRYGPSQEQDVLGKFEIRRFTVLNEELTEVEFVVKNYLEKDIVIFEQHFTQGIKDTGYKFEPDGKENPFFYPTSAFPGGVDFDRIRTFLVFEISGPDEGLGFITPGGNMLGNTRLTYGNFSEGSIRDNIKVRSSYNDFFYL